MSPTARTALRAAAVAVCAVLALLGLGEAGLRWAGRGPLRPDRFGGSLAYRFPPNEPREIVTGTGQRMAVATIGANGYRVPQPAGPLDIACLGDSWTFGWGVADDESWPARLAQASGRAVGNFGIPGYAMENLAATWREVVRPLEPDVVVVATFVNDLETVPRPPSAWRRALRRAALGRLAAERSLLDLDGSRPLPLLGARLSQVARRPGDAQSAPYVAYCLARLDELLDELAADGRRVLVVSLPLPVQMQRVQKDLQGGLAVRPSMKRHAGWQLLLAEHLEQRGVPLLELLPNLARLADRVILPLSPTHPNAVGQRLIAEEVERELRERGWLD